MNETDRKTLLIVDDASENIEVLDGLLSEKYRIRIALDGPKALSIARSDNPPDLILLDIMMPEMDGYEVIRHLKDNEISQDIPVIFITTLSDVVDETRGLLHGAVDYITKPFNPAIVKARVATHLALAESRMTLVRQSAELARKNEELIQAAVLKEDIERINRHDLKTPIGSVIALPDFLLKDDNLSDEQRETLETIRGAGYQMLNMVNSTLDMYKMEQGTYKPHITSVDVVRLCRTITTELQELAAAYSVFFVISMEGKPVPADAKFSVAAEETLLYSMLANLVKNAVEASPPGKQVLIEFRADEQAIILIHSKSTIPKEIRETFFDKYVTYGKEEGSGLGTYSAKLIATTLNGSIRYETSETHGTVLIVSLPWPKAAPKPISQPKNVDIKKLSFLIADDMPNIRMIAKRTLQQAGVTMIIGVSDGFRAIEELKKQKFDCVISDWNMPNINGLNLLKWVRNESNQRDIPFLMLTAERTEDQVLAAAQSGVSGYIVKPFTPQMLSEKLKAVLHC
ncbi:MAG: response regulator [Nitrospinae bacterium]|nr:response regulator [Nitrospinota bacterium]MBF0634341.1 response regulator [Nitrospinota bacterium]